MWPPGCFVQSAPNPPTGANPPESAGAAPPPPRCASTPTRRPNPSAYHASPSTATSSLPSPSGPSRSRPTSSHPAPPASTISTPSGTSRAGPSTWPEPATTASSQHRPRRVDHSSSGSTPWTFLAADPGAKILVFHPAKALADDQLHALAPGRRNHRPIPSVIQQVTSDTPMRQREKNARPGVQLPEDSGHRARLAGPHHDHP